MFMWQMIITAAIAVFAAGLIYISVRSARFAFVQKLVRGKKFVAWLVCFAFFAVVTAALALLLNVVNSLICILHLCVFWLICDLAGLIINKIRGKKPARYYAGGIAAALCAVYLVYGWVSAHNVQQTFYEFSSGKITEKMRIVQISDSHIGAVFGSDKFAEYIAEINTLSPDVVVITGDFVDDDTPKDELLRSCDALGELNTKYGVFFVWGNHDKGYYSESSRGWSHSLLRERLEANGVTVLEDDYRLIGESVYIVGRLDRSGRGGRKSAQELLRQLDPGKYTVILDHQPHDFAGESEAGADLVLCGHTHGGQFIPIRHVGEWIGENDLRYGHEKWQGTDFIVSSGIGCWSFKFKTGCISEYVIIDLKPANN